MRRVYQQRRQLLMQILNQDFNRWLEPIPSHYGMHISAGTVASTQLDLEHVTEKLARNHIQLHTLSRYYLGPQTRQGLIFGLGTAHPNDLRRALSALHTALRNR
jgi:GntR family transcriptional regulator/MocR family aminotransferase